MTKTGKLYISNTKQQSYIIWDNNQTKQIPAPIVWNFPYKKLPKQFRYTDYTFPIKQDTLQESPITIYIQKSSGITDSCIAWCGDSKPTCIIQPDSLETVIGNSPMSHIYSSIKTLESSPLETYQQKSKIIEKPAVKDADMGSIIVTSVVYDSINGVLRDQKTNSIYNCSKWDLWKKVQKLYQTNKSKTLVLDVELKWNIFSEKYQVSTIRE